MSMQSLIGLKIIMQKTFYFEAASETVLFFVWEAKAFLILLLLEDVVIESVLKYKYANKMW